jgi:hypothetical protein
MTRRTHDDDGTSGVTFGTLTATAADQPRAGRAARKPGPAPQADSLRQQLERGDARWLKVALPVDLARAVHVAAAERDTTPSQVVADLVRQHLT